MAIPDVKQCIRFVSLDKDNLLVSIVMGAYGRVDPL
jgi:hypothetical protein